MSIVVPEINFQIRLGYQAAQSGTKYYILYDTNPRNNIYTINYLLNPPLNMIITVTFKIAKPIHTFTIIPVTKCNNIPFIYSNIAF